MSTILSSWIYRYATRMSWLVVVFAAACLAGCPHRPSPLPNDAYVWQRLWTPALTQAVVENASTVRAWRVLAAEMDAHGQWRTFAPDWRTLDATRKPVMAVIRIEGQLAQWDEAALIGQVQAVMAEWRQHRLAFAGVEIDHDCATSRLPAYAHFLTALHPSLRAGEHLSITALPTWLDSSDLERTLAQADEAVLQVHAVQSPRAGLFNPVRANGWMNQFARRVHTPWRVALPAYGTRVSWDAQGRVAAIESERPTLVTDEGASELFADPSTMQAFVAGLEADTPAGLAGIVWFRLPTGDDTRAWSTPSWQAVLARQPLKAALLAEVKDGDAALLHDLWLRNMGNADVPLPSLVRLEAACSLADGINGYALQRTAKGTFLQRTQVGLLRAGQQLRIGWVRCDGAVAMQIESGAVK